MNFLYTDLMRDNGYGLCFDMTLREEFVINTRYEIVKIAVEREENDDVINALIGIDVWAFYKTITNTFPKRKELTNKDLYKSWSNSLIRNYKKSTRGVTVKGANNIIREYLKSILLEEQTADD